MKRSLFLIASTVMIIYAMWTYSSNFDKSDSISVSLIEPQIKNIYDYVNAKGKIKEGNKKDIYIENTSKIDNIYVKTGDFVEKGDVIMKISPLFDAETELPKYSIDTSGIESVFKEHGFDIELHSEPASSVTVEKGAREIKSPISGIITSVDVSVGDNVTVINKLATVSDFTDLYIEAMVPEMYSANIKEGQRAEITGEAFGDRIFTGSVSVIYPVAKQTSSLMGDSETYLDARVDIERYDEILRPGLTVNVKISAKTVNDALTIPYECILQDENNREYVFANISGKAQKRYIDIGYELSDEVEVKSGLTNDTKVVINPPEGLTEGMEIMVLE